MSNEKLTISILADMKDFQKGIKDATSEVGKFDSNIRKMDGKINGAFKSVAKGFAVVTAAAVGFGVGLFKVVENSAEAGDRIDKMSQKMGMSTTAFQEWDYILSQNGASIDSMKTGMKTLTSHVDNLIQGNQGAIDTFERIGLSMDDLKGKSQEEIFEMTIKGLQGIEDPAERAALATKLLGKSGMELAPLLNSGAMSIEELREQAHELGIVLDEEAIEAAAQFTDTLDDLKRSFQGIMVKVGNKLMPMFQKLFDWIISNMPTIQKIANEVFNKITEAIQVVINVVKILYETYDKWIGPLKVIGGLILGLVVIVKGYILTMTIVAGVTKAWAVVTAIATGAGAAFGAVLAFITSPIGIVIIAIGALIAIGVLLYKNWDTIKKFASKLWEGVKKVFSEMWEGIKSIFDGIKESMSNAIQGAKDRIILIITSIKEGFRSGFTAAKDIVVNIFSNIVNGIRDKMNAARDAVKSVIDKIKGFFKFEWSLPKIKMPHVNISGKFSLMPPSVPKFSIQWRSRGAIFKKPTVLGNGQGVGDASNGFGSAPEVVAPLSDLRQMLGLDNNNKGNTVINLNGNYGFRDKDDMDYLLNEMALATRRV